MIAALFELRARDVLLAVAAAHRARLFRRLLCEPEAAALFAALTESDPNDSIVGRRLTLDDPRQRQKVLVEDPIDLLPLLERHLHRDVFVSVGDELLLHAERELPAVLDEPQDRAVDAVEPPRSLRRFGE